MAAMSRFLTVAFACLLIASSTQATEEDYDDGPVGRTLFLRDDGGVVVLVWDGERAIAYRNGHELSQRDASSWLAAMWGFDEVAYGVTERPVVVDWALSELDVQRLVECDWSPQMSVVTCGL
jgi:hypothetical protein